MSNLHDFLSRPSTVVAPALLGCEITTINPLTGEETGGLICETEAYLPEADPAAHNKRGHTPTTAPLFGEAGNLYVHQMRQHLLVDIVVEGIGVPGSVLIRALQPTKGIPLMISRRGTTLLTALCRGPGNLCKALGITRTHTGQNLQNPATPVKLHLNPPLPTQQIATTARIGLTQDLPHPLRFLIKNSPYTTGKPQ